MHTSGSLTPGAQVLELGPGRGSRVRGPDPPLLRKPPRLRLSFKENKTEWLTVEGEVEGK